MAHHSSEPFGPRMMGWDSRYGEMFRQERESATGGLFHSGPPDLGATGEFPQGKLTEEDEGEIRIGITVFNGKVVTPEHVLRRARREPVNQRRTNYR